MGLWLNGLIRFNVEALTVLWAGRPQRLPPIAPSTRRRRERPPLLKLARQVVFGSKQWERSVELLPTAPIVYVKFSALAEELSAGVTCSCVWGDRGELARWEGVLSALQTHLSRREC